MVEMLTVIVRIISNSQVSLLKNVGSFCKYIGVYAKFND